VTAPRRAWPLALAISVAMLVVPLLAWLLVPSPRPPPPHPPRARPTVAAIAPPQDTSRAVASPSPRPTTQPSTAKEDEAPAEDGVAGTVVDSDGQPVARAFVGCDDRGSHLTTSTDQEGRFRLPAEASGCLVLAHHAQHPSSERVRVEAGKDNVVRLGAGGTIEGVAVDEQGTAVPAYRLTVELFLPKAEGIELGPRGRPIKVDDPAGAFRWEKLPAGKYVLAASAQGHPPGKSDTIAVEAGQTTRNVRIVIPRGATMSGTVLDAETRRPIEGALVRLDAMNGGGGPESVTPATTDQAGNYSLVGVPPGPFSVRVERDGYKSRIVSGLTTKGASTMREDITLNTRGDGGAGSELEGIGAILAPTPAGIVVASLVEAGPAAKAGVLRGDRIVRIDGISAVEMTLPDAIQKLRGPQGSRVSISIEREGEGAVEVTVRRERIER
jgi:hypothetical protein